MRTLYLVNEPQESIFVYAYSDIAYAINHVEREILTEDHFKNLSQKDRKEAALDWVVEVEVY